MLPLVPIGCNPVLPVEGGNTEGATRNEGNGKSARGKQALSKNKGGNEERTRGLMLSAEEKRKTLG